MYLPTQTQTRDFSSSESQEMLNALVENDQQTFVHLSYTKAFVDKLKEDQGVSVPWVEGKYKEVLNRYTDRQNELKNSRYIRAQSWVGDKINSFKEWLGLGQTPEQLGALPLVPVAIGFATATVLGFIVWQIFKPRYSDSTRDLVISKDLKEALEKVSPETQQRIIDDLENQIDKAYGAGTNQGAIQQLITLVKYGLIGGLSIWLFLKYFPLLNQQVKETQKKLETS